MNGRLRILLTGPALSDPGGVSGYYNAVLPHLRQSGHDLHYLEIGGTRNAGNVIHPVVDQLRFRLALRRLRPDLVVCNPSLDLKSFLRDGMFVRQAQSLGIRTLVFFHGWDAAFERRVERLWRWYFNATFLQAQAFIVLASDFRRRLVDWRVNAPIHLGTTAVASELLADFKVEQLQSARPHSGTIRLLFLARLERSKGIREALAALALLRKRGRQVSLTVAGAGGALSDVQRFAASHPELADALSVVGDVRGARKQAVLASHDIYCFPSYTEGMPNSVLEAMAFGLPVVTAAVGGLADFFEDGRMGCLLPAINAEAIATVVEKLIDDAEGRKRISAYNHGYAVSHFLAPAAADVLLKVIADTAAAAQQQSRLASGSLITGPSLADPGGVSSYYNAVLPLLRQSLPELRYLEIGSTRGSGGVLHPLVDQWRFRTELKLQRPGLVLCNPSLDLKSFLRDGLFVRRAARLGIPTLVFFRGWDKEFEKRVGRWWKWFFNSTYRHADAFVVLASEFRVKLRQWGVAQPVYLGTTAVASELIRWFSIDDKWRSRDATQPLRVLFLARLEVGKGIRETLGALALLRRKGLAVMLTVAGDGDAMSEVRQFLQARPELSGFLSIVGDARGEYKRQLLTSHDIYCFPSYTEGMPNSVLEAMAFGLPVVTAAVGGLADFFEDGKMGRVLKYITAEDVAVAIENLGSDVARLRSISEYNHQYALAKFLAPAAAERLVLVCQGLTGS